MTLSSGQQFKPKPHPGGWLCLGIGGILLASAALLADIARRQPVSTAQFWRLFGVGLAVLLAAIFLYRAVALFRLQYRLTRNGLTIRWGTTTIRVPIGDIRTVTAASTLPVCTFWGITLPRWWFCHRDGQWLFATGVAGESLVVKTGATEIYLSPENSAAFITAWEKRVPLGETRRWQSGVERRGLWAFPLWFDRTARYFGIAIILLTLILVGAVFSRYPALPPAIHLPAGVVAQTAAIASRGQLLWIPYSGAIVAVINLALGAIWYRKDPLATYLLWFVAIMVEIGLWVGFRIVVQ